MDGLDLSKYIFDRTKLDVERWRELRDKGLIGMTSDEKKEWNGEYTRIPSASRGMYTHNDLNRVETGVSEIVTRLQELGLPVPEMTIKTNWTYRDTITKDDMIRYFSNVETLRSTVGVFSNTPRTPTVYEKFDYTKANAVEKILYDVSSKLNMITESRYYVGELRLGEV